MKVLKSRCPNFEEISEVLSLVQKWSENLQSGAYVIKCASKHVAFDKEGDWENSYKLDMLTFTLSQLWHYPR